MKKDKKGKRDQKESPMLDPKIKKEQNVDDQDIAKKPENKDKPVKEDPDKVPESNDPVGYGEGDRIKKSPYKKEE